MHREWVDRSAHRPGRLQTWDPRLKVGLSLGILLAISFGAATRGAESWIRLAAILLALLCAAAHGRAPLAGWLGRSLVLLPFAAAVAAAKLVAIVPADTLGGWTIATVPGGVEEALRLLARAWLSILATLLLALVTPFPAILAALSAARVPRGFLAACALVHRYLWVLIDEGRRLLLARRLRSGRGPRWRSGGRVLAALFARSLARAHRVEVAIRLRGSDGGVPAGGRLRWSGRDSLRLALSTVVLAAAILAPRLAGREG